MYTLKTFFLSNPESPVIFLAIFPPLTFLRLVLLHLLSLEGAKKLRLRNFREDFCTYLIECDPNFFKKVMDSSESLF